MAILLAVRSTNLNSTPLLYLPFYPLYLHTGRLPMKNQFIPIVVESTRKLGKPILYVILTFATVKVSHSLYCYMRNLTMSSSSSTSTATDAETLRRNRILSSKLNFDVPLPRSQWFTHALTIFRFLE
ncbi:hypothetical protein Patl1_13018 [Pistacia atlantica]|uniref:Uncharacterized protein n=1 Tax=Pistacia atlantica TaxID=434234 RepID=A0ACC1AWQ1_9ROSI|nr:hypothetical protein Patl1_13018 [Pistacia atlantica]